MDRGLLKVAARQFIPGPFYRLVRESWMALQILSARHRNLGRGTYMPRSAHVLGWRSIAIGENSIVGEDGVFNVNHREAGHAQIRIGAHCFIGARAFFSPAQLIEVGDYGLIGIDCKFLGSGHIFSDPFKPYIASGTAAEGRMVIGTNCWLGVGVTLLGSVAVGHGSVVGAGSFVRQDVPPFSLAVGDPARVIRRYDPLSKAWIAADGFTADMAAALPDQATYLAMLRRSHPWINMPVRAAGKSQGDLP